MYCSSCGVAVAQGLSYCNYCGAKLNGVRGDSVVKSSEVKPEMLVSAMVAVFVLGIGAIPVLVVLMHGELLITIGQVTVFILLVVHIIISIECVLIRQLL